MLEWFLSLVRTSKNYCSRETWREQVLLPLTWVFTLPFIFTTKLIDVANLFLSWFQADVCHAYQILKKGGLKDENIIVFMYDDIAYDKENPRPGVIINKPDGDDVYAGVPKVWYIYEVDHTLNSNYIDEWYI